MAASIRMGKYGTYIGNTFDSSNYLTYNQMKVNALYIYNAFKDKGWTLNAVAGMLGNMQRESTLNPGIWQNNDVGNTSGGYGLVQWTPATKYIDWLLPGSDASTMDNNISRILYELENNLQWISTELYPMSFQEFTKSTERPEDLASVFLYNYERAGVSAENERRENALNWYLYLGGIIPPYEVKPHRFPWVIYANKLRNK